MSILIPKSRTAEKNEVPSANYFQVDDHLCKLERSNGPKIEPCGTSALTEGHEKL